VSGGRASSRPRARILGPGLAITVEDVKTGKRVRVRVRSRSGSLVEVETLPGTGIVPSWSPGAAVRLRVARPFGLFCYSAKVEAPTVAGCTRMRCDPIPPRRRQLRDYFRMPVRLGIRLEGSEQGAGAWILRAVDLSAGGILLLDPDGHLRERDRVRLGLPIGPAKGIIPATCRVLRLQENPRRAALIFEEISETARQILLRYLFRQHRRRGDRRPGARRRGGSVTPISEIPS